MSQDENPFPSLPIVPLLLLIVVALCCLLAFQLFRPAPPVVPPIPVAATVPSPAPSTTPAPGKSEPLPDGREFLRETAEREGVRLVEPQEVKEPEKVEGIKIAVQKDRVYDSLLKWNVIGKVEDKAWGARKIVNMVYIAEANIVQNVEENDGSKIVVIYEFRSIKSLKALYELESIKLDFLEGAPARITTASIILSPLFDMIAPGTGVQVRIGGTILAMQAKPTLENLALQGYKMVFDPGKANDEIKMFGQVNTLQGKKVRITHQKGAVARIIPLGCELSPSERNFCLNLGVLANYHLMPETGKKVGERWNVKASNFSNMLEPTLRSVPSGQLEIVVKERNATDGTVKLELAKGTIELDSSDPKAARIGKCTPKGVLMYDAAERYVTQGELTADLSIERTSRNHLLFETKFKSNPVVSISYQCTKKPKEDKEILRLPELEKEKFHPIPIEVFSPFSIE